MRRWTLGFLLSGGVVLAAGMVQRRIDQAHPDNDQPVMAEMVSAQVVEDGGSYFVTGMARYSIGGRSYESELVDSHTEASRRAIDKSVLRYAPSTQVQVFFSASSDPARPYTISLRQGMRQETTWVFFAVLLGGVLLFAGASFYPITRYATWAARSRFDWIREIGFIPIYVLLVPVVVGMLFLFEWYFK